MQEKCHVQDKTRPMRLLFVADGRSPIAINWIEYLIDAGHEVHLASTFNCRTLPRLASLTIIPIVFSSLTDMASSGSPSKFGFVGKFLRQIASPGLRTNLRQRFVPLTLPNAAKTLRRLIARLQPDLVHAMRIPYEGMLTALAEPACPCVVSVWGNDFTLHAPSTRTMQRFTRLAMKFASALHTDCFRDQRMAYDWGFERGKPAIVLPGAGGVQRDVFYPAEESRQQVFINPRGLRAYVRNDTFFQSIPAVLQEEPRARFICPAMQGETEAITWVERLGLADHVELLPRLNRVEMAELFRLAQVVVSITTHDGTPNTLLEALACGCFPITGDIEPLREWITNGKNGFLVDPGDPRALTRAMLEAMHKPDLRRQARNFNLGLIQEKADYNMVMERAFVFYQEIIDTLSPKWGYKD